jgi:hypothetical protein
MNALDSTLVAYSDARTEYTKQLCQTIVPAIMKMFLDMLQESREATKSDSKRILWHFQTALNAIPDWNMEKVNNEIERILQNIACEYLEDLITAVFIAHTKILTAIRMNNRQKKIQITVPKLEHFLFKVIIETSKIFWKSTYLFRDDVTNIEKQQNYRQIETLVHDGISQAIRCMVPVKSILKDCMLSDEAVEDEHEDAGAAVAAMAPEEHDVPAPAPAPAPHEEHELPAPAAPEEDELPAEVAAPGASEEHELTAAPEADEAPTQDELEEQILTIDEDESNHVQFSNYNTVFNEDESEIILDNASELSAAEFTEFKDLDAPVEDEPLPFDEYETLE